MAHRSRWGWHPCDYSTYRLLKALHRLFEQARRQHAAWRRWQRKLPNNRVIRRTIVDDNGNRVGREVVGPQPEPPITAPFCVRRTVLSHWSEDGRPLQTGRPVETVELIDHGIPQAYRAARFPAASEQEVPRLPLTPEEVRRLAEQAGISE
jgi:hypothetical protein